MDKYYRGKVVSLHYENAPVCTVLAEIKKQIGVNVVCEYGVKGVFSISENGILWENVVRKILMEHNLFLIPDRRQHLVSRNSPKEFKEKKEKKRIKDSSQKSSSELWKEESIRIEKYLSDRRVEREGKLRIKEQAEIIKIKTKETCNVLLDHKRKYDEDRVIWYRLDTSGERVFLTDSEIEESYKKLEKNISLRCTKKLV
ncbi:MAG: hypothetical protein JKX76_04285 [Colwellia sp.]|nr:hypothetical protein [Colwellia sp.]